MVKPVSPKSLGSYPSVNLGLLLVFVQIQLAIPLLNQGFQKNRFLSSESVSRSNTTGSLLVGTPNQWNPIRIHPDFSKLGAPNKQTEDFVKSYLIPRLIAQLSELIQVQSTGPVPAFNSTACDDFFTVPQEYNNKATDTDLILFFTVSSTNEAYQAYSNICAISSESRRPMIGYINFYLPSDDIQKESVESRMRTLIHESFHILAFSPYLYDKFPISSEQTYKITETANGTKLYKFVTPGLVQYARNYFGCNSLDGVALEDEGKSGSLNSHFEKKFLGNEIMTGQYSSNQIISNFTLNFLNDIGWYKVDLSLAEPLSWGSGKGCSFLQSSCDYSFSEFCQATDGEGCTSDFSSKSSCVTSSLSNKCGFRDFAQTKMCSSSSGLISTSSFENASYKSKCFLTSEFGSKSSGCYESTCLDQSTIQVKIQEEYFNCTSSEQSHTYKSLTIKCPDPSIFCKSVVTKCPNDCSGKGSCLGNGTCKCNAFYKGSGCQEEIACKSSDFAYCDILSGITKQVQEAQFNSSLKLIVKIIGFLFVAFL
jgi:hypothetical protein